MEVGLGVVVAAAGAWPVTEVNGWWPCSWYVFVAQICGSGHQLGLGWAGLAWVVPQSVASQNLQRKRDSGCPPELSSPSVPQEIDAYIVQAKERSYETVLTFGKRGLNIAASAAVQAATKVLQVPSPPAAPIPPLRPFGLIQLLCQGAQRWQLGSRGEKVTGDIGRSMELESDLPS